MRLMEFCCRLTKEGLTEKFFWVFYASAGLWQQKKLLFFSVSQWPRIYDLFPLKNRRGLQAFFAHPPPPKNWPLL